MDSAVGHCSNRSAQADRPRRLSAQWSSSREVIMLSHAGAIRCLASGPSDGRSLIQPVPLGALRLPPCSAQQLSAADLLSTSCRAQRRLLARNRRGGSASALNAATPSRVSAPTPQHQASLQSPLQRLRVLIQQFTGKGKPPSTMCNYLLQECENEARWPDVWQSYLALETTGVRLTQLTYYTLWKAAIREGWVTQATQLFRRCTAVWGVREQKEYTGFICLLLKQRHRLGLPTRELAYQMWREMLDHYAAALDAVALRTGIAACCCVGRLQEAEELLRWGMKADLRVGHGSFHRIMHSHVERGDMVAAYQVFDRMLAIYPPCTIDWNTLVWGHARQGDVAAARAAMDRARASGCELDAWTWSSLVHAYAKAGDMTGAEAAVSQALSEQQAARLAAHAPLSPTNNRLKNSPETANGIVPHVGHVQGGATSAADQLAASPAQPVQPAHSSAPRDDHTCSTADVDSRSSSNGVGSSSSSRPGSGGSNGVVQGRPRVRQTVSTHMYAALVDGYMRLGKAPEAEKAAARLYSEAGLPPSVVVYNTLLRGYCKLGVSGQARALELLVEMRMVGCMPNADTYTTLLAGAADLPGGGWAETPPPPPPGPTVPTNTPAPANTSSSTSSTVPPTSPDAGAAADQGGAGSLEQAVKRRPAPSFVMNTGSMDANGSVIYQYPNRIGSNTDQLMVKPVSTGVALNGASSAALPDVTTSDLGLTSPLSTTSTNTNNGSPVLNDAQSSIRASPGAPGTALNGQAAAAGQSMGRPSVAGEGLVPSLMRQLYARGQPADAAVLTTLMMLHSRAGRYQWALAVFEELRASSATRPDAIAWAALAAVHAKAGALAEAAAAAEQAAAVAQAMGMRVPEPAFGVLVHAHAAAGDLPGTLNAFKRLLVLGGRPHKRVLDVVVRMCLERDLPDAAVRALRATELAGVTVDRDRYSKWVSQWQALAGRRQQPSPQAGGFERLKWWLGLPNRYYSSEWDDSRRGGSGQGGGGVGRQRLPVTYQQQAQEQP